MPIRAAIFMTYSLHTLHAKAPAPKPVSAASRFSSELFLLFTFAYQDRHAPPDELFLGFACGRGYELLG